MASIELDEISKVYPDGTTVASPKLSLEIGDGEFMVLVGPSGCGKTTALRMVAGLEDITAGAIRIGDRGSTACRLEGPRHRDGVPELRALPAPHRRTTTSASASSCAR